jgi:hypothetical protein
MDPDPAIFVIDLQDANKKLFIFNFFCLLLFEGTFTLFFKDKKSQNSKNQGFSYYFYMMIEGSGSIPLTNGSGSERPKKNMGIRIRNTGEKLVILATKAAHKFKNNVLDPCDSLVTVPFRQKVREVSACTP